MSRSLSNVAGFVLAGGRSSRMRAEKALQVIHGKQLIKIAIEILDEAGIKASIAGARIELSEFGPVISDPSTGSAADDSLGPLSGICSALSATEKDFAVFVTVDMPLIPPESIQVMVESARMKDAPVTVASIGGQAETFPVVLRRTVLPILARELSNGRLRCFAALREAAREAGCAVSVMAAEYLVQAGQFSTSSGIPPHLWFANVNTPADLARADAVFRTAHRVS